MKKKSYLPLLPALAALTLTSPVLAADFSLSGYGTVGYARSNQSYSYQRFIDDKGTFDRDSLFAVQGDVRFDPRWSATLQVKMAPAPANDNRWQATTTWAFVSWRPDNDWLLRFGKLRIPGYLNAENMEVGATFDFARVPAEISSVLKTVDFTGASFNRTWGTDDGEWNLDGYWGKATTEWRNYYRDSFPGVSSTGPFAREVDVVAKGLALTFRANDNTYIASFHDAEAKRTDGLPWPMAPVRVNPGGNYYYSAQASAGAATTDIVGIQVAYLGADIALGNDFRLMGEYARRKTHGAQSGMNSTGSYISLLKRVERWTPYVYYAKLRSDDDMLALYQDINGRTVPAAVPQSARINASQRALADSFSAFDQYTFALGTSYVLTPTSKVKAEWARTHVGVASSLVDAPAGGNVSHQSIDVLSLSYSFVF
ncbi:hypothetical protein DLREEDagrD3_18650 [Denitratisoma sp. agr-D3]